MQPSLKEKTLTSSPKPSRKSSSLGGHLTNEFARPRCYSLFRRIAIFSVGLRNSVFGKVYLGFIHALQRVADVFFSVPVLSPSLFLMPRSGV